MGGSVCWVGLRVALGRGGGWLQSDSFVSVLLMLLIDNPSQMSLALGGCVGWSGRVLGLSFVICVRSLLDKRIRDWVVVRTRWMLIFE